MAKKLTKKQKKFVEFYLADPSMNATKAAISAGFSKKNASAIAGHLVKKSHVRDAIDAAVSERTDRNRATADKVVERLWALASANPLKVAKWGKGWIEVRPSDELSEAEAACISEISQTHGPDGEPLVKVKFHPPGTMISLLMQHFGLLDSRSTGELSSEVKEAISRLKASTIDEDL